MAPPTITQIARDASVSVALVSRFVNNDPALRISPGKRKQILDAVERAGGMPVSRRRKQRDKRLTYQITVPVNARYSDEQLQRSMSQSVAWQVHFSLHEALKAEGFRLGISLFDEAHKHDDLQALASEPRRWDGMVMQSGIGDEVIARMLLREQFPHVGLNASHEQLGLNSLLVSEAVALGQAVEHLQQLGHRRIGYFGPRDYERFPSIIRALAQANLSLDDRLHCFTDSTPEGPVQWRQTACQRFLKWLDAPGATTAFFCSHDRLALGMMDAMSQRGLTPGRQLSVVGYGNLEQRLESFRERPGLTTLDHPVDHLARRGAQILLRQILLQDHHIAHERVPSTLIIRNTTGPAISTHH